MLSAILREEGEKSAVPRADPETTRANGGLFLGSGHFILHTTLTYVNNKNAVHANFSRNSCGKCRVLPANGTTARETHPRPSKENWAQNKIEKFQKGDSSPLPAPAVISKFSRRRRAEHTATLAAAAAAILTAPVIVSQGKNKLWG